VSRIVSGAAIFGTQWFFLGPMWIFAIGSCVVSSGCRSFGLIAVTTRCSSSRFIIFSLGGDTTRCCAVSQEFLPIGCVSVSDGFVALGIFIGFAQLFSTCGLCVIARYDPYGRLIVAPGYGSIGRLSILIGDQSPGLVDVSIGQRELGSSAVSPGF